MEIKPHATELIELSKIQRNTAVRKEKQLKQEPQQSKPEENPITRPELEKRIESVNRFLDQHFTSIRFQLHEELDRYYVEVVDQNTKEVIREIPSKKFLDMISSMLEHIGLIVDKRI